MLNIKNVSKLYGRNVALSSVDLELAAGRIHVLVGSSGCGKSTLLRIIMGLIQPTEGEILVDGRRMEEESQREIARSMGYVIQEGGLFPHLTATQNVALVARTLQWSESRIQGRIRELSTLVNLDPSLLNCFPRELSGGQRQRVGLMRALMLQPRIVLMDEPFGALDPIVRSGLQEEIRKIFRTIESTVVMVTHDMGEAAFMGDTITLLNEGRVIQHGSFSDLVEKPATPFVREFLRAQRPPPELGRIAP